MRIACFVDSLLEGAAPARLHIDDPTTDDLVINVATAKTLAIKLSQAMRVRATVVME